MNLWPKTLWPKIGYIFWPKKSFAKKRFGQNKFWKTSFGKNGVIAERHLVILHNHQKSIGPKIHSQIDNRHLPPIRGIYNGLKNIFVQSLKKLECRSFLSSYDLYSGHERSSVWELQVDLKYNLVNY